MADNPRLAAIRVPIDKLAELLTLKEDWAMIQSDVPVGAKLRTYWLDCHTGTLCIVFEHESLLETGPCEPVTFLKPPILARVSPDLIARQ